LKVPPYRIAPDVFTPPLDSRSIAPPRIVPGRSYGRDAEPDVA
jgi:hypothetical protein